MRHFLNIGMMAAAVVASPATAQVTDIYSFDVKAGTLVHVLADISAQSGVALKIAPGSDTAGMKARGIHGRHTVDAAIEIALRGSGRHAVIEGDTIRIVGEMGSSGDIIVTASRGDPLRDNSSLLTRTLTPLHDTPGTIDSVTQATLKTQNAISFAEALRNIPGVTVISNSLTGTTVTFGPDQNSVTLIDGMRANSMSQNITSVNVEAIEVLKGPASILTGSQVAGGTINYVPKRATGTAPTEIAIGVGSGGETIATADMGGAISRSKGLFYRAVALSQHADHLVAGGNDPHDRLISGMLGYRANHTTLDLTASYDDQQLVNQNYYYFNTVTKQITPWGTAINRDSYRLQKAASVAFNGEQDLVASDALTLKLRARAKYEQVDVTAQSQYPEYISGNTQYQALVTRGFFTNGTAAVDSYARTYNSPSYSAYGDIYARFYTGPLTHQFIVAGDIFHQTIDQGQFYRLVQTTLGTTPPLMALDGSTTYSLASTLTPRRYLSGSTQKGLVIQDLIEFGPLHVLGAGRFSWYSDHQIETIRNTITSPTDQHKFLPNAGAVLDITKKLAFYVNYTSSFLPRSSSFTQADGSIVPPTIRDQIEGGVKFLLPSTHFAINASVFHYTTNNSPIYANGFYTVGPGQRATGAEISATGKLAGNLDIVAGYTYTYGKLTTGAPIYSAPKHVANLWVVKSIPVADKQKVTLGLGGNYQSNVYIYDVAAAFTGGVSTFVLDHPFFSVNTAVGYKIGKTTINLTVDNILDRLNLQTPYLASSLAVSTPRRFRLMLSQQF